MSNTYEMLLECKKENKKLREEIEYWKNELVEAGVYARKEREEKCTCPTFYKTDCNFNSVSYYCPLHGR